MPSAVPYLVSIPPIDDSMIASGRVLSSDLMSRLATRGEIIDRRSRGMLVSDWTPEGYIASDAAPVWPGGRLLHWAALPIRPGDMVRMRVHYSTVHGAHILAATLTPGQPLASTVTLDRVATGGSFTQTGIAYANLGDGAAGAADFSILPMGIASEYTLTLWGYRVGELVDDGSVVLHTIAAWVEPALEQVAEELPS